VSRLALLGIAALLVLAAAVVLPRLLGAIGVTDSPERAAEEWMQALLTIDSAKLAARTCGTLQKEVDDAGGWQAALGGESVRPQDIEVDLSDLTFTTLRREGDTAVVSIHGVYRISILGVADSGEADHTCRVVREGGRWRYCGEVFE
jgi:hypothetical protein